MLCYFNNLPIYANSLNAFKCRPLSQCPRSDCYRRVAFFKHCIRFGCIDNAHNFDKHLYAHCADILSSTFLWGLTWIERHCVVFPSRAIRKCKSKLLPALYIANQMVDSLAKTLILLRIYIYIDWIQLYTLARQQVIHYSIALEFGFFAPLQLQTHHPAMHFPNNKNTVREIHKRARRI